MLTNEIPELDKKGLRSFGLTTGAIVAVLFGLIFPYAFSFTIPLWPWVIAGVLAAWALIHANSLRPVYRGWMRFGLLLSKITTPIILGIVFFIVVMPMGFLMRIFAKDPMRRRLDPNEATYRVVHSQDKNSMEQPF